MYSINSSLVAQMVKNPPAMKETWAQSLGWEDTLEKRMATHCSMLAWERGAWGHKESDTTEQLRHIHIHSIVNCKNTVIQPISKHFLIFHNWSCISIEQKHSISFFPQVLATYPLHSPSVSLTTIDAPHVYGIMHFLLLWLFHFS